MSVSGKEIEEWLHERAHQIWEEEGRPEGREREHWKRALREAAIHFRVEPQGTERWKERDRGSSAGHGADFASRDKEGVASQKRQFGRSA